MSRTSTSFLYKHKVHKHTQPQIREIFKSTLLSTATASDLRLATQFIKMLDLSPKLKKNICRRQWDLTKKQRNTIDDRSEDLQR